MKKTKKQKTNKGKGDELELAVYFIQKNILESDPAYRGRKFTIERNVKVVINGRNYQIDVLVTVDVGLDTEARLIFECKNQKKAVERNEVTLLATKVHKMAASRGFLVAEKFSKEAELEAADEPYVRLIKCASQFESAIKLERLMETSTNLQDIEVVARIIDALSQPVLGKLDLDAIWQVAGRPRSMREVLFEHANRLYSDKFTSDRAMLSLEGTHRGVAGGQIIFDPKEMVRNDQEVQWLELRCHYEIHNVERKLTSKFEMKGYGRSYRFEPLKLAHSGKKVEVTIVDLSKQ